ncbi:hypothetical protein DFH27DRAFT_223107 [Peziza echinospora]|nr:hypothetical protein DFH27DRAFT_223107 [Peziza echinospora]
MKAKVMTHKEDGREELRTSTATEMQSLTRPAATTGIIPQQEQQQQQQETSMPISSSTPVSEKTGFEHDVAAGHAAAAAPDRSSSSFMTTTSTTTIPVVPSNTRQKASHPTKSPPPPALQLVSSRTSSRVGTPVVREADEVGTPTIGPDDDGASTTVAGSPVSRRSRRLNSAFFEELDDSPSMESEVRRASVRRMKVAYSGGSLRESITGTGGVGSDVVGGSSAGSIYAPGGSSRGRWRDHQQQHQQPHSPSTTPQPSTPAAMYPSETISVPQPTAHGFAEWERRQWAARGSVGTAGERSITTPDQVQTTDSITSQPADGIALLADEKGRVQSASSGSFAPGEKSRVGTEDTVTSNITTQTTRSPGRVSLNGISTYGSSAKRTKSRDESKHKKNFWRKSWDWVTTWKGFLITVYMLNVIAWGGMLFLLLINAAPAMCHPKSCNYLYSSRRIWVETTSQILNTLFCLPAFGLIPWRFRDLFLLHTSKRTKLREIHGWKWDGKGVYIVVWGFVLNTFFQIALGGLMWGMTRYNRPAWATGFLVVMGCGSAGFAGGWEAWEEKKLKKAAKAERDLEQARGGEGVDGDRVDGDGNAEVSGVGLRGGDGHLGGLEEEEEEEEERDMDMEKEKGDEKRREGLPTHGHEQAPPPI